MSRSSFWITAPTRKSGMCTDVRRSTLRWTISPLPVVVADEEAQAAEPVAVAPVDLAQLRSLHFLVQPPLLELPLVLVAARLRLAELALLAEVDVAVVVVAVVLPLHQQIAALKCRAWRSSTCCWLPV